MPTVLLSKGTDKVTVDIGSEAEKIWRSRGYGDGTAAAPSPAPVASVVATPVKAADPIAVPAPEVAPSPAIASTEVTSAAPASQTTVASDTADAMGNDGVLNVAAADVMPPPATSSVSSITQMQRGKRRTG